MKRFLCMPLLLSLFFMQGQAQSHQDHSKAEEKRASDHSERLYWQLPMKVLAELGIREGMVVADVGAGDGYFTLPLLKKIGEKGTAYASDIDREALKRCAEKCKSEGISNVHIIVGTEDDPSLPEKSCELILMVNTIHLVRNPGVFFKNLARGLSANGKIAIVQWAAEKMEGEMPGWDPKDRDRYSMRTILRMIYSSGLEVVDIMDFLPVQNIYICTPAVKLK
jgi:ubiquinone/menaquinone biosynthesis C-methylase UbiE